MWVWVAMRCFFEVDCTSSILIAANASRRRRRRRLCALCFSRAALPPQQIWDGDGPTGTPLRLVSSLLWKMCCRLEWECDASKGYLAGPPWAVIRP